MRAENEELTDGEVNTVGELDVDGDDEIVILFSLVTEIDADIVGETLEAIVSEPDDESESRKEKLASPDKLLVPLASSETLERVENDGLTVPDCEVVEQTETVALEH